MAYEFGAVHEAIGDGADSHPSTGGQVLHEGGAGGSAGWGSDDGGPPVGAQHGDEILGGGDGVAGGEDCAGARKDGGMIDGAIGIGVGIEVGVCDVGFGFGDFFGRCVSGGDVGFDFVFCPVHDLACGGIGYAGHGSGSFLAGVEDAWDQ